MRVFLLMLLALLNFSCTGGSKSKALRIGLLLESVKEERWQHDSEMFKKRVKELGGEVLVQVANGNDQLQNEQAENLLTMGVSVIVVVAHNGKTAAVIVESAHKAGIPVIAYDRMINDCDLDLYVSFNSVKVGELQAQYLIDRVPKGNYFLLEGSPTDFNAVLLREGQMKALKPYVDKGDIKIVLDQWCKDWQPIEALKHTENGLTKAGNKVDAIVTSYDGLAAGAAQALAEQKLSGKVPISGQDAELSAIKRILDGTQTMTVYKPLKKLAVAAAEAAMALARKQPLASATQKVNNGKIDVPSILIESIVVDKSNIDATVIQDGFLTREQVYGK
jgi:D-xylose transport system substrate-binding protein